MLVYYLIVKISYAKLLFLIKLIIVIIKFKVSKETNFINDDIIKFGKKTRPDQYILNWSKN